MGCMGALKAAALCHEKQRSPRSHALRGNALARIEP